MDELVVAATLESKGALVPVAPLYSGAQMAEALQAYRGLQQALDTAMPDCIMNLDGKQFRKKGYWRAVAVAFGLTVECVEERREVSGVFTQDGRENFGYLVTYRASAPNGRSEQGDGACFAVEKAARFRCPHPEAEGSSRKMHYPDTACPDFDPNFQWRVLPPQASEHNIRSHAHTRAFNRAVSNLVGFGEVSAEEVQQREEDSSHPYVNKNGPLLVTRVEDKQTKNKNVTRHLIHFSDGRMASTIDKNLDKVAREYWAAGIVVDAELEKTQWGYDLKSLRMKSEDRTEADSSSTPTNVAGSEKITSCRKLVRGGATYYGIKTTVTEYFTDDENIVAAARTAASEEKAVTIDSEERNGSNGPYKWVTQLQA